MNKSIIIDPEFQSLIPPLAPEEYTQLEANILAEGCRDALVVWAIPPSEKCKECGSDWRRAEEITYVRHIEEFNEYGELVDNYAYESLWNCDCCNDPEEGFFILLDGHNRYEICQKHDRLFSYREINLASRQAAINWIINNQLGRRNLHPDHASYLRGKRYNGEKLTKADAGAIGGSSKGQNDPCLPESTAYRLATEYQVSEKTIKRDGQYAAAVDAVLSRPVARSGGFPADPCPYPYPAVKMAVVKARACLDRFGEVIPGTRPAPSPPAWLGALQQSGPACSESAQ